MTMNDAERISRLATIVSNNPILLRKLCDRIYELMTEDIRNQRDRYGWRK